jgi:putative membrane-bound dehydrogenase-like protein
MVYKIILRGKQPSPRTCHPPAPIAPSALRNIVMQRHLSGLFHSVVWLFFATVGFAWSPAGMALSADPTQVVAAAPIQGPKGSLRAGAFARNIDPITFPVWVSGGIVAAKGDRVVDSLFARSLVLEQDGMAIAICVVDSLAVPAELVERAKERVAGSIGIPPDRVLISATHAHSAPCVMGAHGTPVQEDYAEQLPQWIAESIEQAHRRLTPARVGSVVTNADRYIHCRHWIMEPGHAGGVLFTGRDDNLAMMNPGHENPFKIRQTNDIDRTLPILSVQSLDGQPIAVLASFCTHYAGAPALSSDYFGVVARELGEQLRPDAPDAFVGIMANGTSGDANCIDFSRPAQPFDYREVGQYVARRILDALPRVTYRNSDTLDGALEKIPVGIRQADAEELQMAQAYVTARLADRLPSTIEENYARETVLLSEWPSTRDIPLQALRIGDLVIAGYPNETFNATGLAVRSRSPFAVTMNIGLANDYAGYLPPADQFPLGGYTSWRARTSCLEIDAEAKVVDGVDRLVQSLAARKLPGWSRAQSVHAASPTEVIRHEGPDTAVPPKESLSHFVVAPLQRIELVAHEPQTIDPVAVRFDDAGDLWIVEMNDYPNPSQAGAPQGRIRVLRDENLDGLYESARTFADQLPFPTGLQFHRDGVLVTAGGRLLFLQDTDGDGRADRRDTWLQGFAEENPQLRVNDPDFGLDQKLYLANGLRSTRVDAFGKQLAIGNSDVRLDWRSGELEAITGPSQFGMTWDRYGNRYFCSNRNPCDEVLTEASLASRSPLAGIAPMTASVLPAGERSSVHPLVSAWTTSNLHAGQFTAACGLLLSDSQHLPQASLGNALTCEPTGSLVHRVGLGRLHGRTVPEEPNRESEWLASRDPWFRPVNLEEGPEGAIYVVDMHRAVIEHPDWVPEELKHRQDELWGDDCGRIYRVLHHQAPELDPIFATLRAHPLRTRSTQQLVDLLDHPREWMRKTAARILAERHDPQAILMLLQFGRQHPQSPGFLRAIHALQSHHDQGSHVWELGLEELMTEWLDDPKVNPKAFADPSMRAALWKFYSGQSWTLGIVNAYLLAITTGSREELIACVEASLANPIVDRSWQPNSVQRLCESADDPYVWMALTALNRDELDAFARDLMRETRKNIDAKRMVTNIAWPAVRRVVALAADPKSEAWVAAREAWAADAKLRVLAPVTSESERRLLLEPQWRLSWAIANGIASSADREWLSQQAELWDLWAGALVSPEFQLSEAARGDLIDLLSNNLNPATSKRCAEALRAWTMQCTDPTLLRRAIAAWSKHADPLFTPWVLDQFASATPNVRSELFQALRSHPERLAAWLDATERGEASIQILDASQIQALRQIEGPLQTRIQALLQGRINTDRQQVIDRYAKALEASPSVNSMDNGKRLFAQHCAPCHRIDGVGLNIGPDISDSRTQSALQLLVAILDPNRAIDNNFFRTTVRMNDSTVHDGIVIEESSQHITLKSANATALVLEKRDLESIQASGVSLMPEGIETQMDPTSMSDLLGYIKNWRYAGGEAPALERIPPKATQKP